MKQYEQDCALCRLMRGLAFSGLGMGIGAGIAHLLGASRENMVYAGIVVATLLVFGLLGRKRG
jgi:hypothetical protein